MSMKVFYTMLLLDVALLLCSIGSHAAHKKAVSLHDSENVEMFGRWFLVFGGLLALAIATTVFVYLKVVRQWEARRENLMMDERGGR
jgi:hypothetical protein